DRDLVEAVNFRQRDVYSLAAGGRKILAHEVGADRQLAVAPIDQDREAHRSGASEIAERVERCADRSSREQHVVDQHNRLSVNAAVGNDRRVRRARGLQVEIVTEVRDIQLTYSHTHTGETLDESS